ncbi:MAG: tetratricopeptide repeat protein [Candidatus Brocadiaceae bacterium]|jgi:tetratricopeptide (TPR) repeat protein
MGDEIEQRTAALSREVTRLAHEGRLDRAIRAARELCEFLRRVVGDYHPALARALVSLGNLLRAIGRHQDSVEVYEEALRIRRRAFGPAHPAVATTLCTLAEVHRVLGREERAEELHREAIDARRAAGREPSSGEAVAGSRTRGVPARADAGGTGGAAEEGVEQSVAVVGADGAAAARPEPGLAGRILRWLRGRRGRGAAPAADEVHCSVFSAPRVAPGGRVFVQAFAHRQEQYEAAATSARAFDEEAEARASKGLDAEVERGSRLMFHLLADPLAVDEPVQSLVWRGEPEAVQFSVRCPEDAEPGPVIANLTVGLDGVPIGSIKFKLSVVAGEAGPEEAQPVGDVAPRYRLAFVSYSSKDRAEVLKRVQMLSGVGIRCFQDVLNLEPGDLWEEKLYDYINRCDLFLLFWSSSARASEWVEREVKCALERKAGDRLNPPDIVPVIIEGPPIPEPPPELAHLHFNDRLLYFMRE